MIDVLRFLLNLTAALFKSKDRLERENAALRRQLIVLRRSWCARARATNIDRPIFARFYRLLPSMLDAIPIVKPETAVRWHRRGFPAYRRWKSRSIGGRPLIPAEIRDPIRDRDGAYGRAFKRRLGAMAIRDRPTAPRSPWQNGHVERLIGSIRRECLDPVIVFGRSHLRRILKVYAAYYNEVRPHLSLARDAPIHRSIERHGAIVSTPVLGGLHRHDART